MDEEPKGKESVGGTASSGGRPVESAFPISASKISISAGAYVIGVFIVLQIISATDRSAIFVMVDDIKADLALNDFQIGLLQGIAFMLFYATLGVPVGSLVDRYSRRWIMYLGVTAWSVAAASGALAQNLLQLFSARMLVGLGESSLGPAVASLSADLFPPKRLAAIMAAYVAASMIGTALSLSLGGWLLDHVVLTRPYLPYFIAKLASWRIALLALTTPGLIIALLALTIREPERRGPTFGVAGSWRDFFSFLVERRSLLFKFLLGYSLLSMASWPAVTWSSAYARRNLGISATEIGSIMGAVVGIAGVVSAIATGMLVDYFFARGWKDAALRFGSIAALIALPAIVVGYTVRSLGLLVLALVAAQCLLQSQFGPGLSIVQLISPPRLRGRLTAVFVLVSSLIGVAVGPMVIGFLTHFVYRSDSRIGWSIATLSGVCLPTAFCLLWSARANFQRHLVLTN